MSDIKRIYVEKKKEFNGEADGLLKDLRESLDIDGLTGVRILKRYDISGIDEAEYLQARDTVLSEPPVDYVYDETIAHLAPGDRVFGFRYLPGQYDQRADSAAQCIQIMTRKAKPTIRAAEIIVLSGTIDDNQLEQIKKYLINPVDSMEAHMEKPETLEMEFPPPKDVEILKGFISQSREQLEAFRNQRGLAMSLEDLLFCRDYFKSQEQRDPTITEIKMLDTYWSDHCRHTTFATQIETVEFQEGHFTQPVREAFKKYRRGYESLYPYREPDISLMSIATMSMKELRLQGKLEDMEVSGEINACSIIREVIVDGQKEEWLIMFKNETHNHPTEIEPFGGAATCLGGAIRDPLSGRSYVYQAMRVTGSGDPRVPIQDTLPGKLPQKKITTEAARGYSSYGNQIGLATGMVTEIYDEGYVAKRMEVGAVIGAVPRRHVRREEPVPGDVVILVGGRTGRDGVGGATGSSKEHDEDSIHTAGAEVQKGNPPEERKLQRLARNPKVSALIKKSNDFGAGGVSVAIGELADGLDIDLDKVPKKYEGLDGTELALSESQERMAVVVEPKDADTFIALAAEENLEAVPIATVTRNRRLRMSWRGTHIVDISRDFIETNGVRQKTTVTVTTPSTENTFFHEPPENIKALHQAGGTIKEMWMENLKDLNVCSQKGLVERFDATVGAATVLMPFGGRYQETPIEAMAAKIPAESGDSDSTTLMSYGFNPRISRWSPFHGAVYSVVEAAAKIVAAGGNYKTIRTSLQEYFEKLGTDPKRWGKPFSALLGAYHALTELEIAAIGGKDSMSGSFKELDVPPTLITFAVDVVEARHVVSPEFKQPGHMVVYVRMPLDARHLPDFVALRRTFRAVHKGIKAGTIVAAQTVTHGGIAAAVSKMTFGNRIGFQFFPGQRTEALFTPDYGSFILEVTAEKASHLKKQLGDIPFRVLGHTVAAPHINISREIIPLEEAHRQWRRPLEKIFPTQAPVSGDVMPYPSFTIRSSRGPAVKIARPRVLIPTFPGSNCEYDTRNAFRRAGAEAEIFVFRNLTPDAIKESLHQLKEKIDNSQIVMLPGGFSAGDEPDGSGKFIAAVFRNPEVSDAVMNLMNNRDGLMLGICNGFQALIKLGLLPYGEIRPMSESCPTLTFNRIGRHISCLAQTKVTSVLSPWFLHCEAGDVHHIIFSHGEGRFVADGETMHKLLVNGQVATRYVDESGAPTLDIPNNPNGSMYAVEGITSPDGRILGKMGHSERMSTHVAKNVPGPKVQEIIKSGVDYFG